MGTNILKHHPNVKDIFEFVADTISGAKIHTLDFEWSCMILSFQSSASLVWFSRRFLYTIAFSFPNHAFIFYPIGVFRDLTKQDNCGVLGDRL